jgi:lysozyme
LARLSESGDKLVAIKMKTSKKLILSIIFVATICGIIVILYYFGILKFNNPSFAKYPVRGVDVSSYQGDIDWTILSKQGISFAFIKATEGSTFVDKYFATNFNNALQTPLRVGAYHFFIFDSPGETQADNFIAQVPNVSGILPSVVDFELYADKESNPPNADDIRKELNVLLRRLEDHYGKKPIIYATEQTYKPYLSGYYETYDIWIRNVFTAPEPLENKKWTFWQYTNRERLKGYNGKEYYIDMNVFNGSVDEFELYAR